MGLVQVLLIFVLRIIIFIYDILTLPIYTILQKPWIKRRESKEPKSQPISYEKGITYRGVTNPSKLHIELENYKIDTMDKVFSHAIKKNGGKDCIGTREVLAEEDEMQPNGRVFKKYVLGGYMWKSFNDVERMALCLSKGLRELGVEPKGRVAIFAETRAEWLLSAIAAFKQNITIVTLYATLGDEAIIHGLNETEVEHIITSHELLPKFKNILALTPKIGTIVYMEDPLTKTETTGFKEGVVIESFCDVITRGGRSGKGTSPPSPDDIAIVMYTSGSTGVPKGVLMSHKNVSTAMMGFSDILGEISEKEDIYMGFLPLAHVLELMCESMCVMAGVKVGYSTPLTMTDKSSKIKRGHKGDAAVLRPTIMASVPLILDRIFKGIQDTVSEGGPTGKAIFEFLYNYKLIWYKRGYNTPILNSLIFGKIRQLVGGRVRLMASGGAPLSPETHEFIRNCLCCPVIQGYGLTETAACATCSLPGDMGTGKAGGPLGCCDIRLVDWEEGNYRVNDVPYPRGEILIGGDNVSMGYFKLPNETRDNFFVEDGKRWFRTGDIGEFIGDGSLKIIDRKKDLVKLQAGEYVSLGKVESELKTCPLIENLCIYGDSSKMFTVALIVPSPKHLEMLAEKRGIKGSFDDLCSNVNMEKEVLKELQEHGKKTKLEKFEIPGAVKLVKDVWSPDTELVTAAFKLKRKNIQQRYQNEINRMYS